MLLRCDQTRVRNRLYTDPFLMIPGWFESWDSGLSHHPGTIKTGSVSSRLRARFWLQRYTGFGYSRLRARFGLQRYIIIPPPLHYVIPGPTLLSLLMSSLRMRDRVPSITPTAFIDESDRTPKGEWDLRHRSPMGLSVWIDLP